MNTSKTLTLASIFASLTMFGCDTGEPQTHTLEAVRGLDLDTSNLDLDATSPRFGEQDLELDRASPLAEKKKPIKETTPDELRGWVRWIGELPYAAGPLGDETGAQCAENQSGAVWYLAGTSGDSATRSCTIPANKKLVFPLVNYWEAVPDSAYPTPEELAAVLAGNQEFASWIFANTCSLTARLDGVDIYTAEGLADTWVEVFERFDVDLPNDSDNFADYFGLVDVLVPTVGAGYYGHLAPLAPGDHVLEYGGALCSGGDVIFATSTTVNLHVE
jgi:hypothetical protein